MAGLGPGLPGAPSGIPMDLNQSCTKDKCVFRSNTGQCIFETCMLEELPVVTQPRIMKCMMCDEEFTRSYYENSTPICDECIDKFLKVGKDAMRKCVICGNAVGAGNADAPFHNICDTCRKELKKCVDAKCEYKK